MPHIILPPSVRSLPRAPAAPTIFDPRPHRNVDQPHIDEAIPGLPDDELIATSVALGMPRWVAEQARYSPQVRWVLAKNWCIVKDAAEGDGLAKEQMDYIREQLAQGRRDGLISDTPEHAEPI